MRDIYVCNKAALFLVLIRISGCIKSTKNQKGQERTRGEKRTEHNCISRWHSRFSDKIVLDNSNNLEHLFSVVLFFQEASLQKKICQAALLLQDWGAEQKKIGPVEYSNYTSQFPYCYYGLCRDRNRCWSCMFIGNWRKNKIWRKSFVFCIRRDKNRRKREEKEAAKENKTSTWLRKKKKQIFVAAPSVPSRLLHQLIPELLRYKLRKHTIKTRFLKN